MRARSTRGEALNHTAAPVSLRRAITIPAPGGERTDGNIPTSASAERRLRCAVYRVGCSYPVPTREAILKSLLDPTFKYIPSTETDIRKTFARVRRQARQQQVAVAQSKDAPRKVSVLFAGKGAA